MKHLENLRSIFFGLQGDVLSGFMDMIMKTDIQSTLNMTSPVLLNNCL